VTRINTNTSAVCAQTNYARTQTDLQTALQRLSSGVKINRGADDPAGLIASERLRSEIAGIGQGITNSERASNVVATAEGALNEVSTLLTSISGLIIEAANSGAMSDDEIAANQLQVDSAIESIARIANTTAFAGKKLIDGSLDYLLSGVEGFFVADTRIYDAKLNGTDAIPIALEVTLPTVVHDEWYWASGHPATLTFPQPCNNFSFFDSTLTITGPVGSASLHFLPFSGTGTNILNAINNTTPFTGLTATIGGDGNDVVLSGDGYITVKQVPTCVNHKLRDQYGNVNFEETNVTVPAKAIINGISYPINDQNQVIVDTPYLKMDLDLTQDAIDYGCFTMFYITGGGACFQTGPIVNAQHQVRLAIPSVDPSVLGNASVGYLSQIAQGGDYTLTRGCAQQADAIVQEAIRQVAVLRGRLGAFEKDVLETSINANQITLENVTASESRIRDTDYAVETSRLVRAQVLEQSGTSAMEIANHKSESVLGLLKS